MSAQPPNPIHWPPNSPGIRSFAGLAHQENLADADAAIVGVPFDGGASYRPGARFAPEAIRRASVLLESYHPVHEIDVFETINAVDWGDLELVPTPAVLDEVEGELAEVLGASATPIVLGGDHTILEAELCAMATVFGPVALVMLDAHTDTLEELDGDRASRGGALRRAVIDGAVQPAHSLLAGMRGPIRSPEELSWPAALGFDLVDCDALRAMGPGAFASRVRERVADTPALLSIDLDVVDPAFAPATGTPEIGGLHSAELIALLRALTGVGFRAHSVTELSPPYDTPGGATAMLAANVAFEFLALVALAARGPAPS